MHWKYLLTLVLAVCCNLYGQGTEWTIFRGDPQQTGVTQAKLPQPLAPVWTYQLEGGIETTAAVAGNTVYVGALDGLFVALDLASGKERWKYQATDEIKSSAAVAGS